VRGYRLLESAHRSISSIQLEVAQARQHIHRRSPRQVRSRHRIMDTSTQAAARISRKTCVLRGCRFRISFSACSPRPLGPSCSIHRAAPGRPSGRRRRGLPKNLSKAGARGRARRLRRRAFEHSGKTNRWTQRQRLCAHFFSTAIDSRKSASAALASPNFVSRLALYLALRAEQFEAKLFQGRVEVLFRHLARRDLLVSEL
jgi:hypothetical protein